MTQYNKNFTMYGETSGENLSISFKFNVQFIGSPLDAKKKLQQLGGKNVPANENFSF